MVERARLAARLGLPAMIALGIAGCGGEDVPTPAPSPPPSATSFSVTPCLNQIVPGTGSTVAGLIVPDTITVDLSKPAGFPNGRRLQDPVIDITLAAIFLDLDVHAPDTLFRIPLNPPANDRPFRPDFPYLALPQGNPPLSGSDTATTFAFADQPASAYVRVDRTGMPAVSAALVGGPLKNPFNDADPVDDATGEFVPELSAQLKLLTDALIDDLKAAGLTPCAIPE
ncbi:MAG: hypothetical protein B7X57_06785 [Erythrobacter sp. 34-65-8]|nr:MAG: hypothetical protein B7X57_06785 [Erythrobacter sp. 34-65-8]